MNELSSLHEMIADTVDEFCAQNGGGIPLGFLFAIQRIDELGQTNVHIGCMESQSPLVSAGLSAYLSKVVDIEVEDDIFGCDCEDDE